MKKKRLVLALILAAACFTMPLKAGEAPHSSVTVIQTAKDTPDRLALKPAVEFGTVPADAYMDNRLVSVLVDPGKTYQTMEGFGGAFTESAAVTFAKLSPAKRKEILTAYFDPKNGIGYDFCRTHINMNLTPPQVAAVGDELVDLPLFHRVGLGVAVADAVPEVRAAAHWVTTLPGGQGAVREVCDLLLKAHGRWDELIRPWQGPASG